MPKSRPQRKLLPPKLHPSLDANLTGNDVKKLPFSARYHGKNGKKAELKSIDKEIARIEAKKVKAETKAAESAKKAEAEDVLKKLLASGVSADDILAKLK